MLSLDNCLGANRPLIFTVAESDVELLKYIKDTYKKDEWLVYSSTFARLVPLHQLLNSNFKLKEDRAVADTEVLNSILNRHFDPNSNQFVKVIFLEADMLLGDKQNIRKIKDILSRYQLDEDFTISLIFVSQVVFVPIQLERLGELVFFDLPNEEKIQEISEMVVKKLELKKDQRPSPEVVNNLKGLTGYEIEQSYLQSFHLYQKVELNFIRDFKKNSIAKTDLLSLMETDITFDDIGGMEKLKKWVRKSYGGWTIEGKKFGLPLLKGVLLVGLPGCGKSLVMKAIGNEWGLPVVSFDPSRIFSSRVGDSESNMRRVLNIVENMSPCLLVIDEIEKGLAGLQSSTFSDSGVTARVIGSFLIWMQDCTKPVFIVATANNIQYLPPELINRFDETFFVNLPQHLEREEIYDIHIKRLNRDPKKIDITDLALLSENLSGREIEQALRESMYNAFSEKTELSTELIKDVLYRKTNLLTTMAEQLNYLLKWVGWDEEKKDGIRARFASVADTFNWGEVKNQIEDIIKEVEGPDTKSDEPL